MVIRRALLAMLLALFASVSLRAAEEEGWSDPTKDASAAQDSAASDKGVSASDKKDSGKKAAKKIEKKAKKAKKPKKEKPKLEWEPPSNAKWRLWGAGGNVSVIGPRAVQRTTNGKTQWQAGFTYAKAPRWRLGVSYAALSMRGSARAEAVHLATTRVLQPWEKWTPLVSFGLGMGHGPDSNSLKHISARAGLGMEAFITRHLSVGLSGDYFYFSKAGAAKSEWHALATNVFVAQRFGYPKKIVPPEPAEPEIETSTAAAEGVETSTAPAEGIEEIDTSTDTVEMEELDESPEISTAPVTTIPGFTPPAPKAVAPPVMPPKPTLTPPAGWKAAKLVGTQAVLYVQFDKNKFTIKPEHEEHLRKIAAFLKQNPEAKAFIEGHASSEGSFGFNMRLSRHRAKVVRKYLITKFKINPKRLVPKGYGETHPLASNATEAGRRKNRCTVSYIILKNPAPKAEKGPR